MKREIKFRAFHQKIGMISDERIEITLNGNITARGDLFQLGLNNVEDFVLMQFSGKTDNKNKEIYEGDILKGCFINGYDAIVIFDSGCFCVKSTRKDIISYETFKEMSYSISKSEIIGNIYENPELI